MTVIFADPKPSTADGSSLEPGALRDVMSRYFAGMQRALEGQGATVEKFIGDAVMAVFGLPIRHEDDALRAVRAARDMQDALPALNAAFEAEHGITLANHIGAAELLVYHGVGHTPRWEEPARFARDVARFVEQTWQARQ